MHEIISILFGVAILYGLIGMVALWTQSDVNREREREAAAKRAPDDHVP